MKQPLWDDRDWNSAAIEHYWCAQTSNIYRLLIAVFGCDIFTALFTSYIEHKSLFLIRNNLFAKIIILKFEEEIEIMQKL